MSYERLPLNLERILPGEVSYLGIRIQSPSHAVLTGTSRAGRPRVKPDEIVIQSAIESPPLLVTVSSKESVLSKSWNDVTIRGVPQSLIPQSRNCAEPHSNRAAYPQSLDQSRLPYRIPSPALIEFILRPQPRIISYATILLNK